LPLYCLSVLLCDFWLSFCHCIVCLSSGTSGYLFAIVFSVCPTDRQYNGKKITRSHRGQTDNTMAKR
jgi:hypothetical protein